MRVRMRSRRASPGSQGRPARPARLPLQARLAQAVVDGVRFPPLILVTTGSGGDVVVLEGHLRLTAYMLSREWLPPELEVLVGSSLGMTRWDCW